MFCRGLLGSGFSGHFGGYGGYGGGGGMLIMMGFGLLIFIGLIILAYKLIKVHSPSPLSLSSNSGLNILNERFAKGEINDEEYFKMKIILSNKN